MIISFNKPGWEDYLYWQEQDLGMLKKVNTLIKEISRNPFAGLGHPEPLKGTVDGFWSRRINREHRLVYKVEGKYPHQQLIITQARMHY